MAPALLLLLAVFALPMLQYAWLSTQAQTVLTELEPQPVGLAQWQRLLQDGRFWQDAFQTLRFGLCSVGLELVLGLAVALLLNQPLRGRTLLRTVSLLPWALPTTVMALGWRWIFNDPFGPINLLLAQVGLPTVSFLGDPAITWLSMVWADTWKTTPFVALLLLAGLQTVPADLYEAAALEGANRWQSLRRITLPLLSPYILIAVLFRLAQALGVFDLVQVLTAGGPAGSTELGALRLHQCHALSRFRLQRDADAGGVPTDAAAQWWSSAAMASQPAALGRRATMNRLLLILWSLGPMLWQLYTSFRPNATLTGNPMQGGWTLEHYQALLGAILLLALLAQQRRGGFELHLAHPCGCGALRLWAQPAWPQNRSQRQRAGRHRRGLSLRAVVLGAAAAGA